MLKSIILSTMLIFLPVISQ